MLKYRCTVICPCGPTRVTLDNPVKLGFFNALHHDIQDEPIVFRLDSPIKLGFSNVTQPFHPVGTDFLQTLESHGPGRRQRPVVKRLVWSLVIGRDESPRSIYVACSRVLYQGE